MDKSPTQTHICTCTHYFVRYAFRGSNLSVFLSRKLCCNRKGMNNDMESLFSIEVDPTRPCHAWNETVSQISMFRSDDDFLYSLTILSRTTSLPRLIFSY